MQNKYSEINNFGLLQLFPPKPKVLLDNKEEPKKKIEKKKKKKIKLHRCFECKKKLTIVEQQITCKCKANFCPKHRLQAQHNCPMMGNFNKEKFKQKCGLVGGGKFKQVEAL